MAMIKLQGLVWLLCALLLVAAGEDNEKGAPRTNLSTHDSAKALRRSSRSLCSDSITVSPPEEVLYWRVGGVQNVWCSVVGAAESSFASAHLTIAKDGIPLPHQVVNDSTIQTTLNLTEPESYKLICRDNENSYLCISEVRVGYEPLEVEDLQCVSHNWESFSCNWTMPYNPVQQKADDYRSYLTSPENPSEWSQCSCSDVSILGDSCSCPETCCMWSGSDYFPVWHNVVVLFVADNDLGAANFTYSIDNYAVVLPNAMEDVSVKAVAGRREAVVGWQLPAPMGTFAADGAGVVVRVDHRLTEGHGEWVAWTPGELVRCHDEACKYGQQTVPLEYWWQRFEVRVRLRSAAAPQTMEEDGWWSEWQPRYVNTSAAEPDTAPALGPGTFQVTTEQGFSGLSDLTLTWRTLPTLLHNGPNFHYLAQVCGDDGFRSEVAATDNFAVFHNVSSASLYTLRVSARNSEGGGPWAEVRLEVARPAPPLLPVVVEHVGMGSQDGLYELYWRPGDKTLYTVYLCTGEQEGTQLCTGQLYWTSVGNVSTANLTLRDFGLQDAVPSRMTFALSAEDAINASSGLSWDSCGVPQPYTTARGLPEPGDPRPRSSGVDLPWTLECLYWAGVVEAAEATCCRGEQALVDNCTDDQIGATGDVWSGTVSMEGLEDGVQYTAWLRLHYRRGTSQWSKGVAFTTNTSGVEPWLIAVVAGVCILATVLIVFGLVYSKRKFVDNLKKLRLQPSLPSGLVPMGRQEDTRGIFGSGGNGGGSRNGGDGGSVPVCQSTISVSVRNPAHTNVLPTPVSSRPSLLLKIQERNGEISGRGVTQGGRLVPQQQQHQQQQQQKQNESNDNLLNTITEREPPTEGTGSSSECLVSGSTSEPLLQKPYTHYVSPYFSGSESDGRDAYITDPLFRRGYVGHSGPSSGGRSQPPPSGTWKGSGGGGGGGGSGGYVPSSGCGQLFVTSAHSGYVSAQHGDNIITGGAGYVQADAVPHAFVTPAGASVSESSAESSFYVSADFPMMMSNGPASPQDPINPIDTTDTSHDLITPSRDSPGPSHDPGVPFSAPVSLRGDLQDHVPQEQVAKPRYISLLDVEPNTDWWSGNPIAPTGDKLDTKGSESQKEPSCPLSDAPAPGYIAIQSTDFGKLPEDDTKGTAYDKECRLHADADFTSALSSKDIKALRDLQGYVVSFPAITSGALVPSEKHSPGDSHGEGSTGVSGYVPLSATVADHKDTMDNSQCSVNLWSGALVSPARAPGRSEVPVTDISFIMLDNFPSRSTFVSGETEIKETEMDSRSMEGGEEAENGGVENEGAENEGVDNEGAENEGVDNEGAENEGVENEGAGNENQVIDGLPTGYSRVGELPE